MNECGRIERTVQNEYLAEYRGKRAVFESCVEAAQWLSAQMFGEKEDEKKS